jgi:hypothetical protein
MRIRQGVELDAFNGPVGPVAELEGHRRVRKARQITKRVCRIPSGRQKTDSHESFAVGSTLFLVACPQECASEQKKRGECEPAHQPSEEELVPALDPSVEEKGGDRRKCYCEREIHASLLGE